MALAWISYVLSKWSLRSKKNFLKKIWILCFIRPFSNYVVWHATSDQERLDILNIFPGRNVIVIPNGIDFENYQKSPPLSRIDYFDRFGLTLAENTKVIISMGRLHPVKAFPILINSFSLLLEELPNVVLLIAGGDDGVGDDLQGMIEDLGLIKKVFLGEITFANSSNLN